ncbi:helix-turn-helix domain-containing protein [Paenibacillus sp. PDC88]|uniref:Helix-turn-helix domain-containing protein n=2 Tax=Paenibacillus TaxID=44249 RepID=A0ABW3PZS6_9BACL|nr:helix-turn-helix domain-containing protein [Paenibacillus sp. PDC88]MCM3131012.1 helix-turn-helix domain-containing protein [Paenibacillus sp. MER 78]
MELIVAAKNKDSEAILKLVELFKPDIQRISRYTYLPQEDVCSEIIVEFLEFLNSEDFRNS